MSFDDVHIPRGQRDRDGVFWGYLRGLRISEARQVAAAALPSDASERERRIWRRRRSILTAFSAGDIPVIEPLPAKDQEAADAQREQALVLAVNATLGAGALLMLIELAERRDLPLDAALHQVIALAALGEEDP